MKKLLIGTTNLAKFNDYQDLLKAYNLDLVSLYTHKVDPPVETGKDFEENAVLKAKYYFEKTGIPTLADDGGLEIEALNGEPGVKSRRWLGHECTDEELIAEVFKRMAGQTNRKCRMRIVMAIASPFGVYTSEGRMDAIIAPAPSEHRIKGYPYRSVMILPNYGDKYYFELDKKEQEILSTRKAATEKINDIFVELSK
jgi:XTP/dITP diphosphohydrolase